MTYLNETIKTEALKLLDESLGAFNEQYQLAEYIANIAYEMLLKNINKNVIDIENNNSIKQVDLTLILHAFSLGIKGQLENIDAEHKIYLSITFPENIQNHKNKQYIIGQLISIISHELMHANILFKRFDKNVEINDIQEYYPNVLAIIENEKPNSDLYAFAYGLYSTYYQEVQAFTSQVSQEIKTKFGGKLTYSIEEIKEGIKSSEAYIIYNNNLHGNLKSILEYDDLIIEEYILKKLNKYNLHFSIDEFKKEIKRILNISKKAIYNIWRNSMLLMVEPLAKF